MITNQSTAVTTLSTAEQRRRDLAAQSCGLLTEQWENGYLWSLATAGGVHVSIVSGKRPYRAVWQTSGDRMVKGALRAVDFERSRSFGKVESLFKFLREIE
jgi:hypothetical protein